MKNQKNLLLVVFFVLFLLYVFSDRFALVMLGDRIFKPVHQFSEVFQAVNQLYFEQLKPSDLVDNAIEGMLQDLDPHTVYIDESRMDEVNQQFDGEFEGIGIEFIIHEDFPMVVSPVAESPAEKIGLRSGDKIIKIEGVTTKGITEQEVRAKLLGRKGTEVTISIERTALPTPFDVTIERDRIPFYSVTSSVMLDDSTGYISVGRFARTTDEEFEATLEELEGKGMRRLVLDLRGNSGGILDQAVKMADKFLDGDKRIVYTRGRISSSNEDYYATSRPPCRNFPLIVMINQGTASASEIVAGAIQDWDRGLLVGQTSFGKGLVQQQVMLSNGASVRISVARYYTPSGRLIQRPYDRGKEAYYAQAYEQLQNDSTGQRDERADSLQVEIFKTDRGREVKAGGGITPDVEIPARQFSMTWFRFLQNGLFFDFVNQKPASPEDFESFRDNFIVDKQMLSNFLKFAETREIEISEDDIGRDIDFIKNRLKSEIARNLWGAAEYHEIRVRNDEEIKRAITLFPEAAEMAAETGKTGE